MSDRLQLPAAAARALRVLVALHPSEFRNRYGRELVECVEEDYAGALALGSVGPSWYVRTYCDIWRGAVYEHAERHRPMVASTTIVSAALLAAGAALYCLCCVVPALFGPAGMDFSARLYAYRPLLLGASAMILGTGIWLVFRKALDLPGVGRSPGFAIDLSFGAGVLVWLISLAAPWLVTVVHSHSASL